MTSSAITALVPEPNKEGIVVREGRRPVAREEKERMYWLMLYLDSWNDEAIKQAYNPDVPEQMKGLFSYAASKTEGEKAAWRWIEKNKPDFQFNTVLPDFTVSSFYAGVADHSNLMILTPIARENPTRRDPRLDNGLGLWPSQGG